MHHVAVLDPGTRVPELDCFNRMSRESVIPLSYHLPALHGLDSLLRVEQGLLGIVILGSGASVNDDIGWQGALRDWLAPRLSAGVPALGLCYGHQLLASMLGAEVGFLREDRVKLKGLREIRIEPDPLWGPGGSGALVVSHRECVTRLGPDCVLRGTTEECRVEAFVHRSLPVAGIQAHPEATPAFVANNAVPVDVTLDVLAFGHGVVDGFVQRVAQRGGVT